ncbi:MAG: LPS export ABC transporter periplasmic protein LptC [Candidatus Krumholzibacteriia bacterium]
MTIERGIVRLPTVTRPLAVLALAASLLGLAFLAGCSKEESDGRSLGPGPHPEQRFYDYRLVESDEGVKQWLLESDEMSRFAGEQQVHLVNLHMTFYQDGEDFSSLVADSGRAHTVTKDLFAWGDVVVETRDGRRLETQELYYDNQTGLIHNDVFDRLVRGEDVVTGIGLEATPDLEYIEIKQRVQGEVGDAAAAGGERP